MKNNQPNLAVKPGTSLINKTGSWRTYRPVTDQAACVGCSLCSKLCPEACIQMEARASSNKPKPQTDYDYCKGCGLCARECPVKAIKMVADY